MRLLLLRLLYLCSVLQKTNKQTNNFLSVTHLWMVSLLWMDLLWPSEKMLSTPVINLIPYSILFSYHNMISNIWDICSLIFYLFYFLSILLVDPENKEVGLPCTCLANNWLLISVLIIILIIMDSLIVMRSPIIQDSTKLIHLQLK